MNVTHLRRLTAEGYRKWLERQESGRFELIDGLVVRMSGHTADHARIKLRIAMSLSAQLAQHGIIGEVFGDGMAVRVADNIVMEPDALVRLGAPLADDTVLATDPVIIVEVLSSKSGAMSGPIESGERLANYFLLASVQHYLVVDTTKKHVLHYIRDSAGRPIMHPAITDGEVRLNPPGLSIPISEIFA